MRINMAFQRAPASRVVAYIAAADGRPWELRGDPKLDIGARHAIPTEAAEPLISAALETAACTTRSFDESRYTTCPAQGWAGCWVWQRGEGDEPGVIAGTQHHKLPGVDGFARCTSDLDRAAFIER